MYVCMYDVIGTYLVRLEMTLSFVSKYNATGTLQNYVILTLLERHFAGWVKKELRNTTMHLTNAECDDVNFSYPEVQGCSTWKDVWHKFVNSLTVIINYLYSTQYIIQDERDEYFQ